MDANSAFILLLLFSQCYPASLLNGAIETDRISFGWSAANNTFACLQKHGIPKKKNRKKIEFSSSCFCFGFFFWYFVEVVWAVLPPIGIRHNTHTHTTQLHTCWRFINKHWVSAQSEGVNIEVFFSCFLARNNGIRMQENSEQRMRERPVCVCVGEQVRRIYDNQVVNFAFGVFFFFSYIFLVELGIPSGLPIDIFDCLLYAEQYGDWIVQAWSNILL